jgi:hypothetical protein
MSNVQIHSTKLRGLSFSIAELLLVAAWAEAQGLQMRVQLDHASDSEEYEEVLAFDATWGRPRRHILWRDKEAVYVQPMIGRRKRFKSVGELLAAMSPPERVLVTDVMAVDWPE